MASPNTYFDLLESAKRDPESVGFRGLRVAFASTESYKPYLAYDDLFNDVFKLKEEGRSDEAVAAVLTVLERDYTCIEAHLFAWLLYTKLCDADRASFDQRLAEGLMDSIMDSGDGRSAETAFQVINAQEEYNVLRTLGLKRSRQDDLPPKSDPDWVLVYWQFGSA